MQVEGNWKAAANLQLLSGTVHPPVRIEHDIIVPRKRGEKASADEPDGASLVDARNTASFRTTTYCSVQDPSAPRVRRQLVAYYQEMLARIPLWKHKGFPGTAKAENAAVKNEPAGEDDDGDAAVDDEAGGVKGEPGTAAHVYRAIGILTQVHDPVGEQALLPWEFFVVQNIEDETLYDGPVNALLRDVPEENFPMLFPRETVDASDGRALSATAGAAGAARGGVNDERGSRHAQEGQRLSLYAKMLGPFTGLYPGMAVGIVGEPFQRSARGALTAVLLRNLVLPFRPVLPWRVDRPLPAVAARRGPGARPKPTRVHFCSGPFPRRDICALLRTVTRQALHRGADLLIIGGPLIKPFEDFEKEILPSLGCTFAELLDTFVDALEETLNEYYGTRPMMPHMKVVLVSHPDDVTQTPVLPTTMYALADTEDVFLRSNPCRIAVNGVHFTVCSDDVVGHMRDVMVERWPTAEGSLRRVVEALVQSRWYTPVTELPLTRVDMKHMGRLRMDCVPAENELLQLDDRGAADEAQRRSVLLADKNWDLVLNLDGGIKGEAEGTPKRVKHEDAAAEGEDVKLAPVKHAHVAETMPHVMFLPSTRPQFAHVTHRGVPQSSGSPTDVDDESALDDTARATGVLVVNQEVWSRRSSPKFELRVAEVTIADSDLVAHRGASPANGVACGVLHIFNANSR